MPGPLVKRSPVRVGRLRIASPRARRGLTLHSLGWATVAQSPQSWVGLLAGFEWRQGVGQATSTTTTSTRAPPRTSRPSACKVVLPTGEDKRRRLETTGLPVHCPPPSHPMQGVEEVTRQKPRRRPSAAACSSVCGPSGVNVAKEMAPGRWWSASSVGEDFAPPARIKPRATLTPGSSTAVRAGIGAPAATRRRPTQTSQGTKEVPGVMALRAAVDELVTEDGFRRGARAPTALRDALCMSMMSPTSLRRGIGVWRWAIGVTRDAAGLRIDLF